MAKTTSKPITKEPEGAPVPTKIVLTCPYAVMDDSTGAIRSWPTQTEITDPSDIQYLVGVGAEHLDISEQ